MSAKWRRNKRISRKLDLFRNINQNKVKSEGACKPRNPWLKAKPSLDIHKISKTHSRGRSKEHEPLVDVLEENNEVIVVAEFAGFDKENIRTNIRNQRLILSAETLGRKYHKSLNLPKRVIPTTIRTAYKNGVLEVRLRKAISGETVDNVAG